MSGPPAASVADGLIRQLGQWDTPALSNALERLSDPSEHAYTDGSIRLLAGSRSVAWARLPQFTLDGLLA